MKKININMPNCWICKKQCPCSCYQFDAHECGTVYFCSSECASKFEDQHSCDVELGHLLECEKLGYLDKEWVSELQNKYVIWKDLAEDRHRKWIKIREKMEKELGVTSDNSR